MTPLISSRGFTADVLSFTTTARTRRWSRRAIASSALALSLVFALIVLPLIGNTNAVDGSKSTYISESTSYEFKVHALNCTYQTPTENGTFFRFNSADLPFEFSAVCFGDHRSDMTFSQRYYGGSGILVNANGANASMTLREGGGQFVSRIDYHGQAIIVFNGMAESVTYPANTTTYEGTDQIIQDWRNACWNPDEGILVEHPSNVTLGTAEFYVMTLEPSGTTDLPEFESMSIVVVILVSFLLVSEAAAKERGRSASVRSNGNVRDQTS